MDIVKFFKSLTDKYEQERKCGFCWQFGAPMSIQNMNKIIVAQEDACCVHLFLTAYKYHRDVRSNSRTGLENFRQDVHTFTLFVGKRSEDIGINMYNEIPEHPVSESLWEKIYRPLQECLSGEPDMDLCHLGYDVEVTTWQMQMVQYVEDDNWTGWKIDAVIRENK